MIKPRTLGTEKDRWAGFVTLVILDRDGLCRLALASEGTDVGGASRTKGTLLRPVGSDTALRSATASPVILVVAMVGSGGSGTSSWSKDMKKARKGSSCDACSPDFTGPCVRGPESRSAAQHGKADLKRVAVNTSPSPVNPTSSGRRSEQSER